MEQNIDTLEIRLEGILSYLKERDRQYEKRLQNIEKKIKQLKQKKEG